MTRCPEADRLFMDYDNAVGTELKDYFWIEYIRHKRTCPKCKQRMSEYTQAAKTAEMPEMEE